MARNILESGGAARLTEPRSLRAAGFMVPMRAPSWSWKPLKRAGIASRLVRRLTERFLERDARIMLVDTDEDNADALAFFRQNGFGQERRHVYLSQNLGGPSAHHRTPQFGAQRAGRIGQRRRSSSPENSNQTDPRHSAVG